MAQYCQFRPQKHWLAVPDNNDNVETVYLKFVSQALKDPNANTSSSGSGTSNNRSSAISATQVPEAAKGPTIPAKGYLVQQIPRSFVLGYRWLI